MHSARPPGRGSVPSPASRRSVWAAWWFTAPSTVHGVGVVLGLLALVLSIVALRDRTSTWQRPVALLGAVLGGVGTVVLLWAVAAALLPLAGVTLPDVTGTGVTPTLAP
ncbi:hypothetical protein [Curtobacterium flaccumfaciens]|uniref:hypothetical protein n=1 Tax=Curtobacterium flaccumfaciens TaxID=2035 RepID=UPI001BDE6788|nr:hypothetical protein [Curtobacterium flaccumfaciens]MBT1598291.1 hypothetical protein [Curtobacterium flaccumfaciens pv. flaccumfaciens]